MILIPFLTTLGINKKIQDVVTDGIQRIVMDGNISINQNGTKYQPPLLYSCFINTPTVNQNFMEDHI